MRACVCHFFVVILQANRIYQIRYYLLIIYKNFFCMKDNNFIKRLRAKKLNQDPDNATTLAKALNQLSSGIYTEDERFIFELLQNAVDAYSAGEGILDIKIISTDRYLVFMHNGDAFSERDVKGLCDVGNGNKENDIKKIGYKGIGFKSVFGASQCVYIESGNYSFKFDKSEWDGYWDVPERWKVEYGEREEDKQYLMPWQIIPIEANAPIEIDKEGYNVVTYICSSKIDALSKKIRSLMTSSQFLLFLNVSNIKMSFYHETELIQEIEKQTINTEVSLLVNGIEENKWMCKFIEDVKVPEDVRRTIAIDEKTPKKLIVEERGTELSVPTFDLAFAICIEEKDGINQAKKAVNPVMYTYLPTYYKFGDSGFPFLVNANFLTNAGREHLLKDSEWNKMIVSSIPELYLSWVASFSRDIPNYYEILPERNYGGQDSLQMAYTEAMENALKKIHFIPNETYGLQTPENTIIDALGIRDVLRPDKILQYINEKYQRHFSSNSWTGRKGRRILGSYGVYILGKEELSPLLQSNGIFDEIDISQSIKLISFFQEYTEKNPSEKGSFMETLYNVPFVFGQDHHLHAPGDIYFPIDFQIGTFPHADFISDELFAECSRNYKLKEWLVDVGIRDFSCGSYLNNLLEMSWMLSKDNYLEVGRILYQAYTQGGLAYFKRGNKKRLKLLSSRGELKEARQLYLSSIYNPRFDLQKYCNDDIFIADAYSEIGDPNIWHCIFTELGVPDDINLIFERHKYEEFIAFIPTSLQSIINQENQKIEDPNQYVFFYGYDIHYYPHCLGNDDNEQLKLLFSKIFSSSYPTIDESKYLDGRWNTDEQIKIRGGDFWRKEFKGFGLREFLLKNVQKYPTTIGVAKYASEIFVNTLTNIDLCGSYLPVLDISEQISDPLWISIIPFKRELEIDDLLFILTCISQSKNVESDNKLRVGKIYQRLTEQYNLRDNNYIRAKIQEWASQNQLLSTDEDFCAPCDLRYITIDGFLSKNQIYVNNITDKEALVELLQLFGVRIITPNNILPCINGEREDINIRTRLLSVLSLLALLSSDEKDKDCFVKTRNELQQLIENTSFYSCDSILLTVKDTDVSLAKQTYFEDNKFYFIGSISPATLEPLLTPLCSYLGIKHKERELFVLMTEPEYTTIIKYLKDKEYHTEWLEEDSATSLVPMTSAEVGGEISTDISSDEQIARNNEAKTLVLAHLQECGFEISNISTVASVVSGVKKDGVEYPLVVKSCPNREHRVFINPTEWYQLFKPNSMLWLHFGGGVVAPIKAYELFTYQDKLTLSFDTMNLMSDDRVNKIMEVMHFFNKVHLNLAAINPDTHRGDRLEDYLFNENNPENSSFDTAPID